MLGEVEVDDYRSEQNFTCYKRTIPTKTKHTLKHNSRNFISNPQKKNSFHNRQNTQNLTINRQKGVFSTDNRQSYFSPSPSETLKEKGFHSERTNVQTEHRP